MNETQVAIPCIFGRWLIGGKVDEFRETIAPSFTQLSSSMTAFEQSSSVIAQSSEEEARPEESIGSSESTPGGPNVADRLLVWYASLIAYTALGWLAISLTSYTFFRIFLQLWRCRVSRPYFMWKTSFLGARSLRRRIRAMVMRMNAEALGGFLNGDGAIRMNGAMTQSEIRTNHDDLMMTQSKNPPLHSGDALAVFRDICRIEKISSLLLVKMVLFPVILGTALEVSLRPLTAATRSSRFLFAAEREFRSFFFGLFLNRRNIRSRSTMDVSDANGIPRGIEI